MINSFVEYNAVDAVFIRIAPICMPEWVLCYVCAYIGERERERGRTKKEIERFPSKQGGGPEPQFYKSFVCACLWVTFIGRNRSVVLLVFQQTNIVCPKVK